MSVTTLDYKKPIASTRIAPRTALSPVTLLLQDNTSGLGTEDGTDTTSKTVVPLLPTDATEKIISMGDTLTRWTNGSVIEDMHRVTILETMKGD